jgi:hypothetical protein
MPTSELKSDQYDISNAVEAIELCYSKGWTDGLPVVPATEGAIHSMLDAAGLDPDAEIAFIEQRQVSVTAEKVAINAVMAGCKPEYMPVVVAAIKGIGDPRYSYHGPSTSTGGAAVFMLVNGPIAGEIEMNYGDNLFGPGWRSNATIGRAVRLAMRNVIGTMPGQLDRSTYGHAGKYTFCIAENEKDSPWLPVHVERGFKPEQSTVTVFAALAPYQYYNQLSNSAEGILTTTCAHLRISSGLGMQPQYFLLFSGEHIQVMDKEGWSKDDIRRFCFEHTQNSVSALKRMNLRSGEIKPEDETTMFSLVSSPEDFIVVAAGGPAGAFSSFIPGWGGKRATESITTEIQMP